MINQEILLSRADNVSLRSHHRLKAVDFMGSKSFKINGFSVF